MSEPPAPKVGRTTPDAAVEIAKLLGKALPVVIVGAGLVYMYFQYRTVKTTTEDAAAKIVATNREQLQRELDAANVAMREAYKMSAELNSRMIDNAKTLIELQTGMAKNSGTMVADLLGLKQRIVDETGKFVEAQDEARKAIETRESAQKELAEARDTKQKVELERASILGELERLKREQDDQKKKVSTTAGKRVEDIRDLRTRLETLVRSILEAADQDVGAVPVEVTELARQIRGAVLVDPAALLRDFAPIAADARPNYFDAMVGADAAVLDAALRADPTFEVWSRAAFKDEGMGRTIYLGCRVQAADHLLDVVGFSLEAEKVVETYWLRSLHATLLRDPEHWSNQMLWGIGVHADSNRVAETDVIAKRHEGASWSVMDFIHETIDEPDLQWTRLRGSDKPMACVDWSTFESAHPEMSSALREEENLFSAAVETRRKAADFSTVVGKAVPPSRVPDALLRGRFVELLNAAVALDVEAASRLARRRLGREQIDQIAAVALNDAFKIVGTSQPAANESLVAQTQGPPDRGRISIDAEYTPRWEQPRRVTFVFGRDGADAAWLLEDIGVAVSPEWGLSTSAK